MNHSTETFLRIEAIFNEALTAAEDERPQLVAARCNGDAELEAEVTLLLRACDAEEQVTRTRNLEPEAASGVPHRRRIGPYELDRLLGRGGMGAVYLAHRADGQFEQQMAIKLIDLPLATDLFRERFRQERQILAGLQHPYIARLLDGGVTEGGDLYLALEYVDGVPIHRYCEDRHLSMTQRLNLFLCVCQAVQFAHQNLVVHRDLKPDNIFVAEDGTPRLLDFGTAKLLSPPTENPGRELTREGYQSFTPQYASPEQVLGNAITTASDTYSLGVLLYLLLTGTMPYELKELTTSEMVRVICTEPARRPAGAANSARRLDPDLDAILMKALRKDPGERYLTAEQLAADIQAHLDGRPVAARRGTLRYRAAKFVRRHWIGLAGTGVLAATLAAGVAGVVWQARVANEERRKAEARSADLRQLSNSLLSELDEAIKQLPGSTGVQKLLVTRVLEHLDRMAADAQGNRAAQLDLVGAYTRLGNLQGNPYEQNLGDTAGALASLDKAIALAVPLAPADSRDRDALRALATAQEARSEILFGAARTQEAVASMRAAIRVYDWLIEPADSTPALICEVAAVYGTLGDELGQSGTASLADPVGALDAYRKTVALDNRALSIDPNFLRARRGLAILQMKIGSIEYDTDPAQALKDFQIALQHVDTLPASEKASVNTQRLRAVLLRKQANALSELGEYAQAVSLFTQALEINRNFAALDPQDLRALADFEVILNDEAVSDENAADPALGAAPASRRQNLLAAGQLLSQAAAIVERMLKKDPANAVWKALLASMQVRLATIQASAQGGADAQALAIKGLATLKELARPDQASAMTLDQATSAFLRVEPAQLRDAQFALACAQRGVAQSHRRTPSWMLLLAQAYRATGQLEQSRAAAKEGLALLPVPAPEAVKSRIRKLLEIEARP